MKTEPRKSQIEDGRVVAYIALGANLGDREKNIRAAIAKLQKTPGISVTKISTLLENPAIGGPENSPAFLNAAAEVQTTLGAHSLLNRLLDIEKELGRTRRTKWEPRPVDLDLILYGSEIIASNDLIVPHPLMHQRRFVLEPLAEIAAEIIHPSLQLSIKKLIENLSKSL